MKSYRENNERLVKALEEQNQLNAAMLQSLIDIQRRINSEHRTTNPEGSRSGARRRKRSSSGSSKGPIEGSSSSSHRNKKKRRYRNCACEEFKKERPPTFNGEIKDGEEAEAWILGMRKYFQVQDYYGNMKARVAC